jgi:membrane protein insertase Oxa1/YidC/SpoIIIJ
MLLRKKVKENPIKGCFITLITIVGLIVACFLFCTVMFQLNQASISDTSNLLTLIFG